MDAKRPTDVGISVGRDGKEMAERAVGGHVGAQQAVRGDGRAGVPRGATRVHVLRRINRLRAVRHRALALRRGGDAGAAGRPARPAAATLSNPLGAAVHRALSRTPRGWGWQPRHLRKRTSRDLPEERFTHPSPGAPNGRTSTSAPAAARTTPLSSSSAAPTSRSLPPFVDEL